MTGGYTFDSLDDIRDIGRMVRDKRTLGNVEIEPPVVRSNSNKPAGSKFQQLFGPFLGLGTSTSRFKLNTTYAGIVYCRLRFLTYSTRAGCIVRYRLMRRTNGTVTNYTPISEITYPNIAQDAYLFMPAGTTQEVNLTFTIGEFDVTESNPSNDYFYVDFKCLNHSFSGGQPWNVNELPGGVYHGVGQGQSMPAPTIETIILNTRWTWWSN